MTVTTVSAQKKPSAWRNFFDSELIRGLPNKGWV